MRPLGGVASRMRGVLHGAAADWLGQPDPGEPYLDVLEAIKAGRIVLFSINANRYGLPARRLGAWVLAEAMRVGASLGSAWGAANRCLFLIDEFSSLEEYGGAITKVLAVARESGVATFLFTQSLSRLRTELGAGGAGTVADALGNCNLKAVFRHPEPADAKEWSQRLGDFDRTEYARAVDPETGEPTGHRPAEAGGGALRLAPRRGHPARLPRLRRAPGRHPPRARPAGPGGAPGGAGGGAAARLGRGGGALAGGRRGAAAAPVRRAAASGADVPRRRRRTARPGAIAPAVPSPGVSDTFPGET